MEGKIPDDPLEQNGQKLDKKQSNKSYNSDKKTAPSNQDNSYQTTNSIHTKKSHANGHLVNMPDGSKKQNGDHGKMKEIVNEQIVQNNVLYDIYKIQNDQREFKTIWKQNLSGKQNIFNYVKGCTKLGYFGYKMASLIHPFTKYDINKEYQFSDYRKQNPAGFKNAQANYINLYKDNGFLEQGESFKGNTKQLVGHIRSSYHEFTKIAAANSYYAFQAQTKKAIASTKQIYGDLNDITIYTGLSTSATILSMKDELKKGVPYNSYTKFLKSSLLTIADTHMANITVNLNSASFINQNSSLSHLMRLVDKFEYVNKQISRLGKNNKNIVQLIYRRQHLWNQILRQTTNTTKQTIRIIRNTDKNTLRIVTDFRNIIHNMHNAHLEGRLHQNLSLLGRFKHRVYQIRNLSDILTKTSQNGKKVNFLLRPLYVVGRNIRHQLSMPNFVKMGKWGQARFFSQIHWVKGAFNSLSPIRNVTGLYRQIVLPFIYNSSHNLKKTGAGIGIGLLIGRENMKFVLRHTFSSLAHASRNILIQSSKKIPHFLVFGISFYGTQKALQATNYYHFTWDHLHEPIYLAYLDGTNEIYQSWHGIQTYEQSIYVKDKLFGKIKIGDQTFRNNFNVSVDAFRKFAKEQKEKLISVNDLYHFHKDKSFTKNPELSKEIPIKLTQTGEIFYIPLEDFIHLELADHLADKSHIVKHDQPIALKNDARLERHRKLFPMKFKPQILKKYNAKTVFYNKEYGWHRKENCVKKNTIYQTTLYEQSKQKFEKVRNSFSRKIKSRKASLLPPEPYDLTYKEPVTKKVKLKGSDVYPVQGRSFKKSDLPLSATLCNNHKFINLEKFQKNNLSLFPHK